MTNSTVATTAGQFVQESVAAASAAVADAQSEELGMFQALKNVANFFSYMTTKWALTTFIVVSTSRTPTPHVEDLAYRDRHDRL